MWGLVPAEEEQKLIANFLDKKTTQIDEAIAIKEQQISLLKERKQIIIQKAVTQGLGSTNSSGTNLVARSASVGRRTWMYADSPRHFYVGFDSICNCYRPEV